MWFKGWNMFLFTFIYFYYHACLGLIILAFKLNFPKLFLSFLFPSCDPLILSSWIIRTVLHNATSLYFFPYCFPVLLRILYFHYTKVAVFHTTWPHISDDCSFMVWNLITPVLWVPVMDRRQLVLKDLDFSLWFSD